MKPIIGIVAMTNYVEYGRRKKEIQSVNCDYIQAIQNSGGIPIILTNNNELPSTFLDNIDGLLLIGGEDISEEMYNTNISSNPRDMLEVSIYNYFKNNNKPILGICRGMQLINVAEGGSLKNIVNTEIEHNLGEDGWVNFHEILIEPDTNTFNIIGSNSYSVSSVHHQQIDRIGKNIIVSARARDGVIEAIEVTGKEFILGVQGHIEKCLTNYPSYKKVFDELIKSSKIKKGNYK